MLSYMSLFPLMYFFYVLIPLGPLVYLFIRWRAGKGEPAEQNLGVKVIAYYFRTLGYHIALIGFSILLVDLLKNSYTTNGKTGTAILIIGLLVYAVHWVIVRRGFKENQFPFTGRVYMVFNLILTGLVGLSAAIIWISIILSKRPRDFETPLAFLLVYVIAWIYQSWEFYRPVLKNKKS